MLRFRGYNNWLENTTGGWLSQTKAFWLLATTSAAGAQFTVYLFLPPGSDAASPTPEAVGSMADVFRCLSCRFSGCAPCSVAALGFRVACHET